MSYLPIISGREAIKVFLKIGYKVIRQRGSHIRLKHPDNVLFKSITIPNHRVLKFGLLRKLIRDTGLTVEKFLELLKRKN